MRLGGDGDLALRVLTGAVGIPLLVFVVLWGGPLFPAVLAVVAAGMLWEYHRLLRRGGAVPSLAILVTSGLGVVALVAWERREAVLAWILGAVLVELACGLASAPDVSLLRRAGALALGLVYVGLPLGLLGRLWNQSPTWVMAGFVLVWADDILAYAVGVNLGRRRLAPRISPKKSVEGAIGGLLASATAAWLLGTRLGLGAGQAWILGLSVAVAAQVGDLVESALKREAGVKDSGGLLPGHGGLLDRFDSSLFAFPVLYYLLQVLR